MDQGSNKNHSPAYNFAPTVTKFCVMLEGLSLPHDTKFGNCRCKIVDSRSFHSWSLIHGLRWSGLIKVGPGHWFVSHIIHSSHIHYHKLSYCLLFFYIYFQYKLKISRCHQWDALAPERFGYNRKLLVITLIWSIDIGNISCEENIKVRVTGLYEGNGDQRIPLSKGQ